MTKTSRSLSGVVFSYALDDDVSIFIDNETAIGAGNAAVVVSPTPSGEWINDADAVVSWVNSADAVVTWGTAGLDVFGPLPIGQSGRMAGFTIQTNASDIAMLSLMLSEQKFATNV
jgi:hypothetical protein